MTTGLPTGPLAPPLDGRAAVPWITHHRRVPLIEAEILSNQVRPALFANLPNHHIYLRLMIDGVPSRRAGPGISDRPISGNLAP